MFHSSLAAALLLWSPAANALDLCQPPAAWPGERVVMEVTGANPGESVTFVRGTGPGSSCPPALHGACLDLAGARLLRTVTADASGTATFDAVIPATVPVGLRFGIQAGVVRAGALIKTTPFFTIMRATTSRDNDCATGRVCADVDADADHVHDVCDVCPGGDDLMDVDQDGTPDECQALYDDLVAWWDFNGLEDKSGHGHDAVIQSGALSTGLIDGALELNGAGDYCTAPPSADFDLTGVISIASWAYPDAVNSFRTIVSRGDTRGGGIGDWGLYVTDGEIMIDMNYPAGELRAFSAGAAITAGDWYHIAVVIDDTNGFVDFYLDGTFISRYTGSIVLPTSGLGMLIGTDIGFPHDWDGLIDDVKIWNRPLGDFEIMGLATL